MQARVEGRLGGSWDPCPAWRLPLARHAKGALHAQVDAWCREDERHVSARAKMPSFGSELDRLEPKEPFWMLAWVGVSPDLQGRGVGNALANEIVRLIDQRPAPGWFVTLRSAHA
jgi:ribosomal protein S18 acetylase RimI-like enzyme